MKKTKLNHNKTLLLALYAIVVILLSSLISLLQFQSYSKEYNLRLNAICESVCEKYPDISAGELFDLIQSKAATDDILGRYGIDLEKDTAIAENAEAFHRNLLVNAGLLLLFLTVPFVCLLIDERMRETKIKEITNELVRINRGDYHYDMQTSVEGEISILENELFKTAITLREAAENSRKDKELLKDSLSNISHQLKTPLTSLLINLENLEDYPDIPAEKRTAIISSARRDVNRVNQMVQLILKLSKMEAEAISFEHKETPVKDIVEAAMENTAALSDLKGIEVSVSPESDQSAVLTCDPYWETEAVSNLLKNGIEHARSCVTISYKNYSLYKEITVTNDGYAISPEEAQNIFKRFYSGESATPDSTGIGLSLADSIVRRDGGYIIAEGIKEASFTGTRFVIRFV